MTTGNKRRSKSIRLHKQHGKRIDGKPVNRMNKGEV